MRWLFVLFLLLPFAANAQYFDGLPVAPTVSQSALVPICQGGTAGKSGTCTTYQATVAQVFGNAGTSVPFQQGPTILPVITGSTVWLTTSFPNATGVVGSLTYALLGGASGFQIGLNINGAPVSGCTAITVTSATPTTVTCTAANTIVAGGTMSLVVSNVTGTPLFGQVSIKGTHSVN